MRDDGYSRIVRVLVVLLVCGTASCQQQASETPTGQAALASRGMIHGTVCIDFDADGRCQGEERPLDGIVVWMWKYSGATPGCQPTNELRNESVARSQLQTTPTDARGGFEFGDMDFGEYCVYLADGHKYSLATPSTVRGGRYVGPLKLDAVHGSIDVQLGFLGNQNVD